MYFCCLQALLSCDAMCTAHYVARSISFFRKWHSLNSFRVSRLNILNPALQFLCELCQLQTKNTESKSERFFFFSAQPLNGLCLAYIAGLNFLMHLYFLLSDDWEITKAGVAWPKFLIPFFFTSVNCEYLMLYKYFPLWWLMFILALQLLQLQHSQTRI